MNAFDRKLTITAIRETATYIVGPCSDWQITFCAEAGCILERPISRLEDLTDFELTMLLSWVRKG